MHVQSLAGHTYVQVNMAYFVEPDTKVADQYQIGDEVVYTHEGVVTKVTGYVWLEKLDEPPTILLYQLDCGISVPKSLLALFAG